MIEEINKIIYTAFDIQKNDSCVQCKMADNFNRVCTKLNTIVESNQSQQGGSLNENRVSDLGQLKNVIKTSFGGGVTNTLSSIYQLRKFMNNFADRFVKIKVHENYIKYNYEYINDSQAEYKNTEKSMTTPVTNQCNCTLPSSSVGCQFKVSFGFVHGDIKRQKTRSVEMTGENTEGQLKAHVRLLY